MMIELSLHALHLKNVAGAFRGTSDPFCVVTHMSDKSGALVLGRTETIQNTVSPEWVKVFLLDYNLGTPMKLVVSIFDEVKKGDQKSMGNAVFEVGELLGARGSTKAKRIQQGQGTIFAHVRKAVTGTGVLRLALAATDLHNTEGFLRKPDPFVELSRRVDSAGAQTWDNVHRTPVVHDSLTPTWEPVVLDLGLLCGGDREAPVKVAVYDFEGSGRHVLIGQLETSVSGIVQAAGKSMELAVKGKGTGTLNIVRAEVSTPEGGGGGVSVTEKMAAVSVEPAAAAAAAPASTPHTGPHSFLDYVAGGCQLNCIVAIDFTGSNGDPRQPGTLHHVDDRSNNPYEKAIDAVVSILAKYDTDQQFPVLGFGAKYDGVVNHCFPVGGAAEAHGVAGVLDAYRSVFATGLVMSSPTDVTHVMEAAAQRAAAALSAAQQQRGQLAYTILLIVTDGAVSDVPATAACVKSLGDKPLSIVIVGVGDADFGSMQFLDDLPGLERDLVQFVEFNKHPTRDDLTNATLREIPDQLATYFTSAGVAPGKAVVPAEKDIVIEDEEEEIDLSLGFGEEDIVVEGGGGCKRSGAAW